MPEFSFPATERLKSKKQIQHIFAKGKSIKRFPLRLLYLAEPATPSQRHLKIAVAVSGKKIPKAVERNKVKRWVREAYRIQNKSLKRLTGEFNTGLDMVFVYLPDTLSDYHTVEKAMQVILEELCVKFQSQEQ